MALFARRFHWAFLTCSASFLFADFIGPVAIAVAHQSQQPEAQDPRTSDEAADIDAFLDAHPEIDAQLRTNPLLIITTLRRRAKSQGSRPTSSAAKAAALPAKRVSEEKTIVRRRAKTTT